MKTNIPVGDNLPACPPNSMLLENTYNCSIFYILFSISMLNWNKSFFENSVDPDKQASGKPSNQDLNL